MMFSRTTISRANYIIGRFADRMLCYMVFSHAVLLLLCSSHPFCSARDTLTHDSPIRDNGSYGSEVLVSAGGRFELGFFTPTPTEAGRSNNRYVGIWYHELSQRTVVWVANRDDPVVGNSTSTGVFAIKEGNLQVFDSTKSYWSTKVSVSNSSNLTARLMDSGNLVLGDGDHRLWQSFRNPTDTFIPGMVMDTDLELTSWKDQNDPGSGNFTFNLDQERENQYVISKLKSIIYWKGGEPTTGPFFSLDEMQPAVTDFLSDFSKSDSRIFKSARNNASYKNANLPHLDYNYTRLVMNFTGELQFLTWLKPEKQWKSLWFAPRDQCSVFNACGNFGSCNINNNPLLCKCLPGSKPQNQVQWSSRDFSGGCTRKSELCGEKNDTFLSLKMMKVGSSGPSSKVKNETECRSECLNSCGCMAFSYAKPGKRRNQRNGLTSLSSRCWIWNSRDLNDLQEEYGRAGQDLSVRVALPDLESTERDCKPCGTTIIPYPLSTGQDCGDSMYFRFNCNNSTGQVSFVGLNDTLLRVISITPSNQSFVLQAKNVDHCDHRKRGNMQQINPSAPFKVISWCNADLGPNVVEIGWELPPEPNCTTSADCSGWPHSTCNPGSNGTKRCLCNTNFRWNSSNLSCTQEGNLQGQLKPPPRRKMPLSLILVAVLISAIFLSCIISVYIWRRKMTNKRDQISRAQFDSERRVKELIDSGEFKEEEGIDVPFFDMQSILDATDNFSDANKLGQGGYGPVYKGKFLRGQEIAVKRLSRVSGQGLQEFKNEVVLIAKLQHRNLVRLKGYCMRGEEKILLYEYMPNKSLDLFIFDHTQSMILNWEMRFNIILGIARGLLYLHQDSRLRIVHRDLKTSNILLDEEMNPKISDFGLARIVGGKETEANTNTVVGTYGYMSPEYALDGTFSVKSDVFSFGVVLLEIISGRKNTGFYQSKQTFSLLGHAWRLWTEEKVLDLMDKSLGESCNESQFIKCASVGLLCVQEDPSDRPTMSNVVTTLDSETAIPPSPKQPAFAIRRGNSSAASSSTKTETISEITTTLVEGR